MVRPLQRKKQKNPHRKVTRKSKKMGLDRGKAVSFANGAMPLIAKHWDKNLTLLQNYQRMGLTANLNGRAGGAGVARTDGVRARHDGDDNDDAGDDGGAGIEVEYRSAEEFAAMPAVSVVARAAPDYGADDFDVDGVVVVDAALRVGVGERLGARRVGVRGRGRGRGRGRVAAAPLEALALGKPVPKLPVDVAAALQEDAARGEAPRHLHASENEADVLRALERVHARDFDAMARDIKLNRYQLSAGQLRRKFKKPIIDSSK
ncbi:Nucleolar protein 16 [Physocladia obscura]|uniref:Nucleolar protein 16 n=1 Tax=Physocladia obscura TaxID=109957 RepID=A0AAD5SQX5_9FUNG|nr:Nucleolar protein 16 [Physocladia obscura]